MSRVLLVSPPWRAPNTSCLALATLKPVLEAAGIATGQLYGGTLYPRTGTDPGFIGSYGAHLFAPLIYDGIPAEETVRTVLDRFVHDTNMEGRLLPPAEASLSNMGFDEALLAASVRTELENAERCVERCVAAIVEPAETRCDVVGFSATFESQLFGAFAIARRLKAARPDLPLLLGGSACFEGVGPALLEAFPDLIDAVCHTEGEAVIAPLVRAARGELSYREVPGIAWWDGETCRVNASPPLLRAMDGLPLPEHEAFMAQLRASEWSDLRPRLHFETSRGCWWGQKQLCTFCGLNAEGLAFRGKSAARAGDEILALQRRFGPEVAYEATDNILDMGYLDTLLPDLAAREVPPTGIFYEIKSNLRQDQVATLAAAGITSVQPGIESFSDEVLSLMRKGATGLGQVQLLKWCVEHDIVPIYNVLVGSPGEQPAWYDAMTRMLPALEHLPPPSVVSPVWFERYSPYHRDPAANGLTGLRPAPWYSSLYRGGQVPLERLAYVFCGEHAGRRDPVLVAAQRRFIVAVRGWQWRFEPDRLFFEEDAANTLRVVDRRGAVATDEALGPAEAAVFRFLDRARSLEATLRRFPGAESAIARWVSGGWALRDPKDRVLVVVPRAPATGTVSPDILAT